MIVNFNLQYIVVFLLVRFLLSLLSTRFFLQFVLSFIDKCVSSIHKYYKSEQLEEREVYLYADKVQIRVQGRHIVHFV